MDITTACPDGEELSDRYARRTATSGSSVSKQNKLGDIFQLVLCHTLRTRAGQLVDDHGL
jgi:hypothetical protein